MHLLICLVQLLSITDIFCPEASRMGRACFNVLVFKMWQIIEYD